MATTKITGTGLGLPTANGNALGGASNEWSDLYLAESGVIYFGNDQDVTLTHQADRGLFLKSIGTGDNNPVLLTLQTGETDMAADDVIGKISFQAPDEGTGTDAILIAAAIQARSEGDFAADANATSIDFMVGSSEAAATKMTLNSTGNLLISDGTSSLPSLTNTGDLNTGIYFPAADTVGVVAGGTEQFRFGSNPIPGGSKNMLINGAMTVNQRGSVAVTGSNIHHMDRFSSTWYDASATDAAATVTKDNDSPAGFGSSMKFDVTTIATGGGDYNGVRQRIEAQNLQHLNYGTSDALTCTFSFWFKTTVTGIYSAYFYHVDATFTYVREFTVASADTWEYFQVTLPGYTSTNFGNDTGAGLEVGITFASTGVQASSNNVWQAGGDAGGSANQVNGLSSTSNNIFTTGWQFEVGSVATDFAHEGVETTLAKCQRYYWREQAVSANQPLAGGGYNTSTTVSDFVTYFPVIMRVAPTLETTGTATHYRIRHLAANITCDAVPVFAAAALTSSGRIRTSVASGLTAGQGVILFAVDSNGFLGYSAEL